MVSIRNRDQNGDQQGSSSSMESSNPKYKIIFSVFHLIQLLMHVLQYTISLILMLGFMTFNVWICLSILFGSAIGFWLFGWIKYDNVNGYDFEGCCE